MTASRAVPWDGPLPAVGATLPGGWVVSEVRPGGLVPAAAVSARAIAYAVTSGAVAGVAGVVLAWMGLR